MPLPDDEWSRGKCGLKALQCMALGIPTVMSPVGVNVDIARDGAAVLASTDDDWVAALRDLIHDPGKRARISAAGRRRVEESYSVDGNVEHWADAFRSVAAVR
jgi:glycosyltransferase involved in cell wall biosynthesis